MTEKQIVMFSKDDIGLCGCDNSDDLEMQLQGLGECLRCGQDNCPGYQTLTKWGQRQFSDRKEVLESLKAEITHYRDQCKDNQKNSRNKEPFKPALRVYELVLSLIDKMQTPKSKDKPKVVILDNNPLSIAGYLEDHPEMEKELEQMQTPDDRGSD